LLPSAGVAVYRFGELFTETRIAAPEVAATPNAPTESGGHPPKTSALRDNYEKVRAGMTGEQVRDILGPPDKVEIVFSDSDIWSWQKDEEIVCIIMGGGVIAKYFFLKDFLKHTSVP
jgi:hypothetical protein